MLLLWAWWCTPIIPDFGSRGRGDQGLKEHMKGKSEVEKKSYI